MDILNKGEAPVLPAVHQALKQAALIGTAAFIGVVAFRWIAGGSVGSGGGVSKHAITWSSSSSTGTKCANRSGCAIWPLGRVELTAISIHYEQSARCGGAVVASWWCGCRVFEPQDL